MFFFFFQAEDGIRDIGVTGVQTCALPIFFDLGGHSLAAAQLSSRVEDAFGVHVSMGAFLEDPTIEGLCDRIETLQRDGRSEERRGGKECRSRWSPYH